MKLAHRRPAGPPSSDARPRSRSLAATLSRLDRHLPADLVGPDARAILDRLGRQIPAALTRRIYYECRLRDTAPDVDLIICVDDVSRLLVSRAEDWLPSRLRGHPLWTGIGRLCSAWQEGGSEFAAGVYDLWLEFDADDASATALVPSVFVGFAEPRSTPLARLWSCARGSVEMIHGRPMHGGIVRTARRCLERLPAGGTLLYAGLMYPRDQEALRLCVAPLQSTRLLDYLAAIEWRGSIDQVAATLRAIQARPPNTGLEATTIVHLDLAQDVRPRLGLEIYLAQQPQLLERVVEDDVLDSLCRLHLCAPSKRDALVHWSGHTVEQFPHECWSSLVLRRVSHVKLVFAPGRDPEAKAYLSVFYGFSPHHSEAPMTGVPE
jgi:hypothetical protein